MVPVTSSNSALSSSVMRSSDGCSARQSMYRGESAAVEHPEAVVLTRRVPFVEPHALVDPVADLLLVVLGDSEQHADDSHRHLRGQVVDEVEPAHGHERVERTGAEAPRLRLDLGHPLRREHPAQETSVQIVGGRVLEQDDPRRDLHPALDELEDRPPTRDVGGPVRTAASDIVEPAQRVEVVLLVVVERRLVTHPLPHRIRVGVDVEVVRVVIDLVFRRRGGHAHRPFCADARDQLAGPFGNFSSDPASTRICCPVM